MKSILFLAHRIPYPPNKGDKIRSFHLLKQLSKSYEVYLGSFIDDPVDWVYVPEMEKYCKETCIVERSHGLKLLPRALKATWNKDPFSNPFYFHGQLHQWVKGILDAHLVDVILIFSSVMAQYVIHRPLKDVFLVTDFVDVDSQKWMAYSQNRIWPLRFLYKNEAKRLSSFEEKVAQLSDMNVFVSDQEAKLFKKVIPGVNKPIVSVKNGVDAHFFNPNLNYRNVFSHQNKDTKTIVFTGMMNYWPNIDAVQWFVKHVFAHVLERIQNVEFYIIGAKPTRSVFHLSQQHGVFVTGRVPDVRPYLAWSDLAVVPLRVARGIQNKVLEAMAMAIPIVASSQAMVGIGTQSENLWIEKDPRDWVDRIVEILQKKKVRAEDARHYVQTHFDWPVCLQPLENSIQAKKCTLPEY